MMDLQLITTEMVVEAYGDTTDGISVFKGNRRVGYITDLKKDLAKQVKRKTTIKEYRNRRLEQARDMLPDAVEEMKVFLENQLAKYDCDVFINQTQPNVHINSCKCYIIVNPLTGKHRLGISNPNRSASDMAEDVAACFKISKSPAEHHILINGLSQDDIIEVIKTLCN
ncbi:transcription terminator [Escherichia phage vB-Eco-KMB23]|nr:transcription terminator [Escherichia phage vB-Eco-KMB23]